MFQLKILGKVPYWGNIFQITTTNNMCCNIGDRTPGLWLFPNSTRVHLVTGGFHKLRKDYNLDINPIKHLDINKEYLFDITRINTNVKNCYKRYY